MEKELLKNIKKGDVLYHVSAKNADGTPQRFKVTSIKTWKRRPEKMLIGLKRGLYEYWKVSEQEIIDKFIYPEVKANMRVKKVKNPYSCYWHW